MCMFSIEQEKVLKHVSDSSSKSLMILTIYLCLKHNTQFSDGAMFKQHFCLVFVGLMKIDLICVFWDVPQNIAHLDSCFCLCLI